MFLTQKNQIRGLTKTEYEVLREMCHIAKNLYNVGLYNIRQYFFQESKYLRYESNYHASKDNENYKLLQAGISQQVLKVVDRSFRSFFNLLQKCKRGEYRYHDVKLPKYLPKEGLFPLILSTNAITIKDGFLLVPMSREFKKIHPKLEKISIPFPERLHDKKIKEVRIVPQFNGKFFTIEYVYEQETEPVTFKSDYALGIDFGLDNLATCVSFKDGASFIIDGKKIKSINHRWNKEKAKFQSIADKQNLKGVTERIARITIKRNNQVMDVIHKTARYIINYCIVNGISKVIVGYNPDFKRNINIGKVNNQNFVQIPIGKLREQLANLAERYGIKYLEQEESYTSKASFLDADEIPVYNPDKPQEYQFSGKRVKRGLYQSANGITINADVNGAWNILRKSKHRLDYQRVCKGLLANPLRIRLT